MRSKNWDLVMAGLVATSSITMVVHAEVYLTEGQACKALFPGVKLKLDDWELTPQEKDRVEKTSNERVLTTHIHSFKGPKGETLFIDRVLGKHEFITYALAVNPDGTVKGIEIMEYKETFGKQVMEVPWLSQFAGKNIQSPLRVGKDIKNISGATLSSVHVTNGVRRILETYEILKKRNG